MSVHVRRFWSCLLPVLGACATEATLPPLEDRGVADPWEDGGGAAGEEELGEEQADDASVSPSPLSDAGTWQMDPTPLDRDSACAASSLAAEQVVVDELIETEVKTEVPAPVALYVMFDKSLSMAQGGLWTPAVNALNGFIRDSKSSGMDMALQYFPSGGSCNGSGYSTPAVALGRLPAHESALTANLAKQSANGIGTPIEGALRGATEYCKSFQAGHADEACVAVLVTDGKPEWDNCEKDDAKLAAIAGDAWTKHKVRTFAVGLAGADFTLLDKIAKAGGASDCDPESARFACDVSGGADKLASALARIRDTVTTVTVKTEVQTRVEQRPLECEWQMPKPSAGMTLAKDRVNVTVSGGSKPALQLGRVPSSHECRDGGWHFDAVDAPTRIIACPEVCQEIKSSGHTDVNILLGCQTHVLLF